VQPFGDLDILSFVRLDLLSFVRISRLNWIGHVNRMHSKRKLSQLFQTLLREVDEEDDLNRWWNCAQTDINKCKIKNWKERSKNRAGWRKSFKEAKTRIVLQCHLRIGGGEIGEEEVCSLFPELIHSKVGQQGKTWNIKNGEVKKGQYTLEGKFEFTNEEHLLETRIHLGSTTL